jgi:hypothetical protein
MKQTKLPRIEKHIDDIDRRAVLQSGNPLLLPAYVFGWHGDTQFSSSFPLYNWTSKLSLHILVFGLMA